MTILATYQSDKYTILFADAVSCKSNCETDFKMVDKIEIFGEKNICSVLGNEELLFATSQIYNWSQNAKDPFDLADTTTIEYVVEATNIYRKALENTMYAKNLNKKMQCSIVFLKKDSIGYWNVVVQENKFRIQGECQIIRDRGMLTLFYGPKIEKVMTNLDPIPTNEIGKHIYKIVDEYNYKKKEANEPWIGYMLKDRFSCVIIEMETGKVYKNHPNKSVSENIFGGYGGSKNIQEYFTGKPYLSYKDGYL